jgi:hypothetical protein
VRVEVVYYCRLHRSSQDSPSRPGEPSPRKAEKEGICDQRLTRRTSPWTTDELRNYSSQVAVLTKRVSTLSRLWPHPDPPSGQVGPGEPGLTLLGKAHTYYPPNWMTLTTQVQRHSSPRNPQPLVPLTDFRRLLGPQQDLSFFKAVPAGRIFQHVLAEFSGAGQNRETPLSVVEKSGAGHGDWAVKC